MPLIEALKKTARSVLLALTLAGRARRRSGLLVLNRALKRCRQKTRSPVIDAALRCATWIGDGHVGRQLIVGRAKRPRHPGAHARETVERVAGGHKILTRPMRFVLPVRE